MMALLDLTLVVVVVALATVSIVWRLAFARQAPACAPPTTDANAVVLSQGLARALARANEKRARDTSACH